MLDADDLEVDFIYLAYGSEVFKAENYFSALCLLASSRHEASLRIAVYTDEADYFTDLPVDVRQISGSMQREAQNSYRNKLKSIVNLDALGRTDRATIFFDGDTYMRRSPTRLAKKVATGVAVLHLPETQLHTSPDGNKKALLRAVSAAGIVRPDGDPVGPESWMWNSGVTGLHRSHLPLLEAAIDMGDRLHRCDQSLRGVEQFSLTQALTGSVEIKDARRDVFHYWPRPVRYPFSLHLPEVVAGLRGLQLEERCLAAAEMCPGYRGLQKARMGIRDTAWRLGVPLKGVRVSF